MKTPRSDLQAQLREVLVKLKLAFLAEELVKRMDTAGHAEALPTLLELLKLEAGERHERKVARLLKASQLPPTKTFATLDEGALPRPLVQKLRQLVEGGSF